MLGENGGMGKRLAWGLGAFVMAVATVGCSPVRPAARTANPTSTTPTTATTLASASTTLADPSGPGYEAARQQWIGEGLVGGSALQNTALALAVVDLEQGEKTDSGNRSDYPASIAAIEDMERLPITSVTAAQSAEFNADVATVNGLFDLRGSIASCVPQHDSGTAASATAWFTEPDNTTSGVAVAPLVTAARDLRNAEAADPSDRACYPAAIDDLEGLASASPADIAASAAPGGNHADRVAGYEIGFLNDFFGNFASPNATTTGPLTEPCPTC
jgi:hypothetical protein